MLHLHVRNAEGGHSLAPSDYRPAIDAVRRAVGRSLVLQLTSEAVGIYAPAEQQAMVRELRPEAVSLALREILPDVASEPESAAFSSGLIAKQIVVQYILYDVDDVERYSELAGAGSFPKGDIGCSSYWDATRAGQRSSLADLLPCCSLAGAERSPRRAWVDLRFGPREIECTSRRRRLGGMCGSGLRTICSCRMAVARDNAELGCFVELVGHWPFLAERTAARLATKILY